MIRITQPVLRGPFHAGIYQFLGLTSKVTIEKALNGHSWISFHQQIDIVTSELELLHLKRLKTAVLVLQVETFRVVAIEDAVPRPGQQAPRPRASF